MKIYLCWTGKATQSQNIVHVYISDFSSGHFAERVYLKLTFPRFFVVQTKSLFIRCKKILPVLYSFPLLNKQLPGVFSKKVILQNLTKIIGKHLCWSLFSKYNWRAPQSKFIKKRPQHRSFPMKICKNFAEHLRTAASGFT